MLDQRIKFRHLTCFLEVARLKSVVKAADILAISQPAVSKTIRELEDVLGVELFDRSHRNVVLTPFGEVFQRYAGASVTALKQGVDSVAQARAGGAVMVKVGALPTVSTKVMPLAMRLFKESGLRTTVRIITGDNAILISQLRLGDLDGVVGRLASPDLMTGLAFEHLYSEPVVCVVRQGHPLLRQQPFNLHAIADFTILMPTAGSIIRPVVDRLLIAHGLGVIPDQIETVSMAFGRSYVRDNNAVWIISRGVVADDMAKGMLVELPVDTTETKGQVGLTTRADLPPNLPGQLLMAAIRRAAQQFARDAA